MIAAIDRESCTGCGRRTQTCPKVFRMDTDGKAAIQTENIPWGCGDACCEAAGECPAEIIDIR